MPHAAKAYMSWNHLIFGLEPASTTLDHRPATLLVSITTRESRLVQCRIQEERVYLPKIHNLLSSKSADMERVR